MIDAQVILPGLLPELRDVMKAILLTLALGVFGIVSTPVVAADSCPSGDVCCGTSGINCTCTTEQDTSTPETEYDCKDSATGVQCETAAGVTYATMVDNNCNYPGLLRELLKST